MILQPGGAHQLLAAGDDPGGGAAQEFVGAIDRDIRAAPEEPRRSYSEAPSTITGTSHPCAISATSSSANCPYYRVVRDDIKDSGGARPIAPAS